jgi:DNA-directed RNA polymerase specialized sigma24 family protein
MTEADRDALVRRLWEWGNTLDGCERRRHEINRLLRQASDAENILHAQVITGMPRGGGTGDPTAQAVQMRDDALRRVNQLTAEINESMDRKAEMDAAVRALPDNLQRLLYMRYVRGWSVSYKIPKMLFADRKTVYRWHEDALEQLSCYAP